MSSPPRRPKARYEGCARCTREIRPKMNSRPIPLDGYGQRTLPPDAVKHRDEQLLRLEAYNKVAEAEGKVAEAEGKVVIGNKLHACMPHNCLTIVANEIAALDASQHASSSVTGQVMKSATYMPKPKVKQERGSRDVPLHALPHQAALDYVLPGGASVMMTRQTTTPSSLWSAAGAMGGSGDTADLTPVTASAPSPQPQTQSTTAQPLMPPQGLSELHERGFLKVAQAVDPSGLDATSLTAESKEVLHRNDPDGKVGGDDNRSMRSLTSGSSGLLGGAIMAALGERGLLGERDLLEMRLFVSQPGGDPQHVHCDDDPLHPVYQPGSEDSALCSGILALEAGTSLLLYPSGPEGEVLPVLLDAGDLLLFRGDCWHAGAGYAHLNRRIHFYLSAPQRRREPGYTYRYTPPATAAEPLAKMSRTRSGGSVPAI